MNEISVKTLYPDGSTSPYRALALPAFASLCLMAGALLVLFRTWDELAVPRWALVLAAVAGYVSASAAHRLSRRHGAFYLLGLVPWIPALLMPAACVRGLAAWVSGLTARWNVLHDGSAQLLNTAPASCSSRRRRISSPSSGVNLNSWSLIITFTPFL